MVFQASFGRRNSSTSPLLLYPLGRVRMRSLSTGVSQNCHSRMPAISGLEQARALGEELRGVKFDFAFASPLRRARETAEVALTAAGSGVELELDADLVERDYGKYEGKAGESFDFAKYWDFGLNCDEDGVEAIGEMFERGARVAERLRGLPAEATVLVVAHGGFLKALYFNLVGYEVGKTEFRSFKLKNGEVRAVEV